jgi:hypothetical protein
MPVEHNRKMLDSYPGDPAGFERWMELDVDEGGIGPAPIELLKRVSVQWRCPAEPEKSNLATGPNFGVHYYPHDGPTIAGEHFRRRLPSARDSFGWSGIRGHPSGVLCQP